MIVCYHIRKKIVIKYSKKCIYRHIPVGKIISFKNNQTRDTGEKFSFREFNDDYYIDFFLKFEREQA